MKSKTNIMLRYYTCLTLVFASTPLVISVLAECPNKLPAYGTPKSECTDCATGKPIQNKTSCSYTSFSNLVTCDCNDVGSNTDCVDDPNGNKATGITQTPYSNGTCSGGSCSATAGNSQPVANGMVIKDQQNCGT